MVARPRAINVGLGPGSRWGKGSVRSTLDPAPKAIRDRARAITVWLGPTSRWGQGSVRPPWAWALEGNGGKAGCHPSGARLHNP